MTIDGEGEGAPPTTRMDVRDASTSTSATTAAIDQHRQQRPTPAAADRHRNGHTSFVRNQPHRRATGELPPIVIPIRQTRGTSSQRGVVHIYIYVSLPGTHISLSFILPSFFSVTSRQQTC
eukprot:GHVU01210077.1.p2 GENE.GHVU01210077.1~~GHVU01210077.1.p2  ORF type:complete len:133 (+),score=20.68 GHVU01210077.1:37-399(+)